jgi:hypothetical protein
MNKYKIWGTIAGISTFLTFFGYWAKITHQAYANTILTIGMWSLAISAGVYFYFKFLSLKK